MPIQAVTRPPFTEDMDRKEQELAATRDSFSLSFNSSRDLCSAIFELTCFQNIHHFQHVGGIILDWETKLQQSHQKNSSISCRSRKLTDIRNKSHTKAIIYGVVIITDVYHMLYYNVIKIPNQALELRISIKSEVFRYAWLHCPSQINNQKYYK